jgi:nucleotide-binding universal stress UspA family protein
VISPAGPGGVVVCVDGSEEAWLAFDWAHDEAVRTDRTLVILHAEYAEVHAGAEDDLGGEVLTEAVARLEDVESPVAVATVRRRGPLHEIVSELSRDAAMVVIGSGHRHVLQPRLVGRAQGLLGRTLSPVVVVSGKSSQPTGAPGVITVGVSLSAGGLAAMRFACLEARASGRSVVGVRAWAEQDWKLDTIRGEYTPFETWRTAENATLSVWVERACAEFPEVAIDGVLANSPIYWALEDRAPSSALVVVGARRTRTAALPALGPVTSWAVHHARGAVAVVPHESESGGGSVPARISLPRRRAPHPRPGRGRARPVRADRPW